MFTIGLVASGVLSLFSIYNSISTKVNTQEHAEISQEAERNTSKAIFWGIATAALQFFALAID